MATAGEIADVRLNTDEPTPAIYTDVAIGALVDVTSVALASGAIWAQKAAAYAKLVDVSEAGASRKQSDLFDHAMKMAAHWNALGSKEAEDADSPGIGHSRVHTIVRAE